MRPDLAKLTTERERRGRGYASAFKTKYGGKVRINPDPDHQYDNEFGGYRSSARRRHQEHKEFSDVLNPLRGALRVNLGRPWDKVYSEFCEHLDRRSVSGIHIFSHLVGFSNGLGGEVRIRGLFVGDDGKVYEYPDGGFFGQSRNGKASEVDGFYVHPVTGILKYAPRNYNKHGYSIKAEIEELRSGKVTIDGNKYEAIDGIWFETWYTETTKTVFHKTYVQDGDKDEQWFKDRGYVKHHKTGEWGYWQTLTKQPVLVRKRSLNKKEIKVAKEYILDRIKELELE